MAQPRRSAFRTALGLRRLPDEVPAEEAAVAEPAAHVETAAEWLEDVLTSTEA